MDDKLKKIDNVNTDDVAVTGSGDAELGKFRERLNDIKRDKIKAKGGSKDIDKIEKKVDKVVSSKKIVALDDNLTKDKVEKKEEIKKEEVKEPKKVVKEEVKNREEVSSKKIVSVKLDNVDNKEIDNKIEEKELSKEKAPSVEQKPRKRQSKCVGIIKRKDISALNDEEKLKRLDSLEKKILLELDTKVKRELEELNDLVLENNRLVEEFKNDGVVSIDEVNERVNKLEEILKKLNELIEQVQILQNNYKFEDILNLTDFEDQNIVNDIIEFRDLLDTSKHSEKLTEKYKRLDSFVKLYREVYIEDKIFKHNKKKAADVKKETEVRDDKYLKLKDDVSNVTQVGRECRVIIDKQNQYLGALNKKISEISSNKVTEYRMMGANDILATTLLYIGLMLKMPFKNKKVAAGTKAMATGLFLRNFMKRRATMRQVHIVKFEAEDFSRELYKHIDEVTMVTGVIDVTIDDIRKMREQFNEEFKGKVPGYEDVELKLKEIELMVMSCKKDLEYTAERLNTNVEENEKKLVKVKELNQNAY